MSFKIFDGSSWNQFKNIKINDGTSWQPYKKAFVHNGTEWKEIVAPKPVNTALPELSWSTGIPNIVNQNVSVSNGSWTNSPTSYKYQWQSGYYALSGSLIWEDIAGATSSSYSITSDEICMFMVGRLIRCSVIAINNAGESLPSYGSMFQTIIAPETMTSLSASVSENGVVQLSWSRSKGANGYYLQYQGPEVAFTQMDLGDVTSYTINTGLASGTLGILVAPINTTSPWKTYSNSNVQGQGMNAVIYDLKPLKPRVTATSVVQHANAVTVSWTNERLTQTSYEVRTIAVDGAPVSNGPLNYFYEMYNGSSTSWTSEDLPGGRAYTFKVVVNGTATGFTETSWESNSTTTTLPLPSAPSIIEPPIITSTGRYFGLSRGASWANNPDSTSYSWFANGQPLGQYGGSITLDSSYDGQSIYVVSYATNAGGTSQSQSNSLICSAPSRPTNLTSPIIIELNGSMVVTSNGTWNGNPTSYRYEWKTINDRDFILGVGTNSSSYNFGSNRTNTYYVVVWASNQFGESLFSATSNSLVPSAGNITYGACQSYSNGTDYGHDCSGTTKMTWTRTILDYREPQLLNGVANGTYRYGCSARTYGEKQYGPTYAWTFNSTECGYQQTNCTTCNSYIPSTGNYNRDDENCPSGRRYYRTCITPSGCDNIDQPGECVPIPTDCDTVVRLIPENGWETSPSTSAVGFPACSSGYRYYKIAVKNEGCLNDLIWGDCTASTWYCSLNATDEQNQYTSATDVSTSLCNHYAVACSTSGYPAFPAIPVCEPTPTPTPVGPNCNQCNGYSPYADGSYGTRNNSSCASGSEYYRICITPSGCQNIDQTNGCVPQTPTPQPAGPYCRTEVYGNESCPGDQAYGNVCYNNADFSGPAVSITFISCVSQSPTPTPTQDCNTCVSYGGPCGTYGNGTWCITPGSCPNICQGDYAPAPTPTPTPIQDCNTCVSYGGPCGTYGNGTWCITPGSCPNICQGDYAPAPTPTPTPIQDCNTCVSYGGPCGTYGNGTWCITPGSCPNICQGDYAPAPTPTPTPIQDCNTCVSYGGPCGTYGNGTWCITPGSCPNICQGDYAPTPPSFFAPPTFFSPPEFFNPPDFWEPPDFYTPPEFFSPPDFPGIWHRD